MNRWTGDEDLNRLIRDAGASPSEVGWAAGLAAVCLVSIGVMIGVGHG